MECEPKINMVKACCIQRQQPSQTPDRVAFHTSRKCQQQGRVTKTEKRKRSTVSAEEDKEIQENEDGNNNSRVSGGGSRWQLRQILNAATVGSLTPLHSRRQTPNGRKRG